jgi:hypothetical protein
MYRKTMRINSVSKLRKTLGLSYYCIYSLFNKIRDKGIIVSAWEQGLGGDRERVGESEGVGGRGEK